MAVGFGGALHYPITHFLQQEANETTMDDLREMRVSALDDNAGTEQTASAENDAGEETSTTGGPVSTGAASSGSADNLKNMEMPAPDMQPTETPLEEEQPTAAPAEGSEKQKDESPVDQSARYGTDHALPYPEKEKVQFSEDEILPQ